VVESKKNTEQNVKIFFIMMVLLVELVNYCSSGSLALGLLPGRRPLQARIKF